MYCFSFDIHKSRSALNEAEWRFACLSANGVARHDALRPAAPTQPKRHVDSVVAFTLIINSTADGNLLAASLGQRRQTKKTSGFGCSVLASRNPAAMQGFCIF